MSLETEHRRHYTEPEPLPDEPQPIRWPSPGRHAAAWTQGSVTEDVEAYVYDKAATGRRRA